MERHQFETVDAELRGHFTTADGLRLEVQGWLAAGAVRGAVVLVHGIAEHSGRYRHVGQHLAREGYHVYTFDLRGHGRSQGRPLFTPSFDAYVDDLGIFMTHVRHLVPELPLFLFGHSMGGAIVTLYGLAPTGPRPAGLILSSPMLRIVQQFPFLLEKLIAVLGRLAPTLPTARVDRTRISRDPKVVAEALADPLNAHGRTPARTGAELVRVTAELAEHTHRLDLPFLILHGTADAITDPDASRNLYATASSDDKTLALFPDLWHETLNEPERAQVLDEITEWLCEHL